MRKLALALIAVAIPYQSPADDNEIVGTYKLVSDNAESSIQARLYLVVAPRVSSRTTRAAACWSSSSAHHDHIPKI